MEIIIIMLTAFILFILEGAVFRRLWYKGLDAKAEIVPSTAFCNDKCHLELTISNRKLLPLPWLWIKLHISSSLDFGSGQRATDSYIYHNSLFCIMGWQEIKRSLPFICTKRGYYPLRSFDVIGTSILFNGKHSKAYTASNSLTVYPQLIDIKEIESLITMLDGEIARNSFLNPDPFEFLGIREYIPTDSFKDINFKATAHTGNLMTNTHSPTIKGNLAIILCFKSLGQAFEEERFEYSISLAATIADYYINKGFNVSVYSNGCDLLTMDYISIPNGTIGDILEQLARLSYTKTDSVEALKQPETNASAIFISPTVDMPILDLYNSVYESYNSVKWLYPVMSFDAPRTTPPVADGEILEVPAVSGFNQMQSTRNP